MVLFCKTFPFENFRPGCLKAVFRRMTPSVIEGTLHSLRSHFVHKRRFYMNPQQYQKRSPNPPAKKWKHRTRENVAPAAVIRRVRQRHLVKEQHVVISKNRNYGTPECVKAGLCWDLGLVICSLHQWDCLLSSSSHHCTVPTVPLMVQGVSGVPQKLDIAQIIISKPEMGIIKWGYWLPACKGQNFYR